MLVFRLGLFATALVAIGCGDDAPEGPEPRLIEGGGIGDGPIDGVANLYVVDDATRMPISGATVRIGDKDGVTDADGLFVATGVTGPLNVIAKAAGFRTDMWVGANGANMTMSLEREAKAIPDRANLTATIAGWQNLTVAPTHRKLAIAFYSQTDDLGDPANEIQTMPGPAACATLADGATCQLTITTRVGRVALLAVILDVDPKGTPNDDSDDTSEFLAYAHKPNITVEPGVDQTGIQLTVLPRAENQVVTVDFGSPPANLNGRFALIGIDVGDDGVFQLVPRTPAEPAFIVPKLPALGATGYRLTALAADGNPASQQSIVLRRDLTGTTLSAGAWLEPPSSATVTRTDATWSLVSDATIHGFEISSGVTRVVNVTVLDGTTAVTLPDLVTLPSGPLTATVNAIGAPGLDVTNFVLDEEREKLSQISQRLVTIQ